MNHESLRPSLPTLVLPSKPQGSIEGLGREGGVGGGQKGGSWCRVFLSWAGILLSLPGTESLTFRPDPGALLQSLTL